jgi:hypothetical protein
MADMDDGSIPNDAGLLRRIHPDHVIEDKNLGRRRPMSGAFTDKEMSVDAEPILRQHGLDLSFSLRNWPTFSLARFHAGDARAKGLSVVHDPCPDEQPDNPAHTLVIGTTEATARHFARTCDWPVDQLSAQDPSETG